MDLFDSKTNDYFNLQIDGLINKAFAGQWAADTAIDWNQTPVIPAEIDKETYINMVSQLYYSEVLTIHVCSRVIQETEDFQAKQFLCTQLADEARHAQVYKMYVDKLGTLAPIDPGLAKLYRGALDWKGSPMALIVAINVVLEGEALLQQKKRIDTLPCPLFKDVNSLIIRDESRHAAFGTMYMRDKIALLSQAEKNEILGWISSLWRGWEEANKGRYEGVTLEGLQTTQEELAERYREQMTRFKRIGLLTEKEISNVA